MRRRGTFAEPDESEGGGRLAPRNAKVAPGMSAAKSGEQGAGLIALLPVAWIALAANLHAAELPGDLLAALRQGGHALLIRHAQTEPGVGDPPGLRLDDCRTQRNLSTAGREQARAIGEALRARGIPVAEVRSSQWCRCLDTARLAFAGHAPVRAWPALDSFFDDRSVEPDRTRELRAAIAAVPSVANVVWV